MARRKMPQAASWQWRSHVQHLAPALGSVKKAKLSVNLAAPIKNIGFLRTFMLHLYGRTSARLNPKLDLTRQDISLDEKPSLEVEYLSGEKHTFDLTKWTTVREALLEMKQRRELAVRRASLADALVLYEEITEESAIDKKKGGSGGGGAKGGGGGAKGGGGAAKGGAKGGKK
eukprot:TRINITY_DN3278_c0_g1_i1.p1 TRINITY_DN3278_c0_g1~~TRINITY_DN3278_c0_g1_i1.p1  ORF type:complete len:181 (-),score=55.16 TRINITY_DN3278_c0_g1_i1:38-556(-)